MTQKKNDTVNVKVFTNGILGFFTVGGVLVYNVNQNEMVKKIAGVVFVLAAAVLVLYNVGQWLRRKLHEKYDGLVENFAESVNSLISAELDQKIENIGAEVSDLSQQFAVTAEDNRATKQIVSSFQSDVVNRLNNNSMFEYKTTVVTNTLRNMIEKEKDIDEIRIICYGRSGYGDIVQHIFETKKLIKVKIIMCNPEEHPELCGPADDAKIKAQIKMMLENGAEVYVSDIPPAIRASTVYFKGKAIWSTMQSYQFRIGKNGKLELHRPTESLISVCSEKSTKKDFDGMVRCFQAEYDRLLEHKMKPEKDGNDDIVFVSCP